MSKEYIEREAVLERIEDLKDNFSPTVRPMFDVFKHIVTTQPAAEVAPVVHGEWITGCNEPRLTSTSAGASKFWFTCSICGRTELKQEPYCHCGAKMDGGN